MLTYLQAIILGLLQGVTELFPISSLGHSVLLPSLLGWNIDQNSNIFVIFLVTTHFATALVLLGFFIKDWVAIIKGMGRSLRDRVISKENIYGTLGWLIVVATVPAGILGLLFETPLKALFASPIPVSIFLILNGIMLYIVEKLKRPKISSSETGTDARIAHSITWSKAVRVGFAQCLALLPGFSRTGATLAGSLSEGLDHEASARFSFLLATPIIFAAALLKVPELASGANAGMAGPVLIGALTSAVGAYFSVRFLTNYFKTKTLMPFAYYCMVAGVISFAILLIK
jgi:undecaprenyl-diphosphatase